MPLGMLDLDKIKHLHNRGLDGAVDPEARDGRDHIDVQLVAECGLVEALHAADLGGATCIVDKNVETFTLADIGALEDDLGVAGAGHCSNLGRRSLELLDPSTEDGDGLRARLRKGDGDFFADACPAAGDGDKLAGDTEFGLGGINCRVRLVMVDSGEGDVVGHIFLGEVWFEVSVMLQMLNDLDGEVLITSKLLEHYLYLDLMASCFVTDMIVRCWGEK
ncbi:unnamed protein product [Clonostachys rosea f. rosea IK726]|uniref:Uncharacterized protein n=1 Tax=Clonostachys rosea f. rosea IK726 TaxID=1349383 RepID=A0ACA9TWS2_BIOOC|nr:unnamed protein product [Clonostachys rosea f. rosea IK726]